MSVIVKSFQKISNFFKPRSMNPANLRTRIQEFRRRTQAESSEILVQYILHSGTADDPGKGVDQ